MSFLLAGLAAGLLLPAALPGLLLFGTAVDLAVPAAGFDVYSGEWSLLGALLGLGLRALLKRDLPPLPWKLGLIFLPLALLLAAHGAARDFLRACEFFLGLALPAWLLAGRARALELSLAGATAFALVAAAYGLAQTLAGPGAPLNAGHEVEVFYGTHQAASSFFQHHNQFAAFLSASLALAPSPLSGLVLLAALFASYSRGAWLGLAAGTLSMAWAFSRRRLLFGAAALIVTVAAVPALRQRALSLASGGHNSDRVLIWGVGKDLAAQKPCWGHGEGAVQRLLPARLEALPLRPQDRPAFASHLHNQWLQWTVEYGLLGAACWALFLGALFLHACAMVRGGERRARRLGLALGIAVAAFCVQSLTDLVMLHGRGLQVSLMWGLCLAGMKRG